MAEKHPTKLVAYTPRLDTALKRLTKWSDAITLNEKNPRGKKQSIESFIPVETETETGYNGYFKLIDMSETDANGVTHYRLGIADGATFNGETSGPSKAVSDGNGRSYDVPFHVIDVPDEVIETSSHPYSVRLPYSTTEGAGLARLLLGGYITSFDVQLGLVGIDYEQKKLRIRQHFTDGVLYFNVKYEEEFTVSVTHTDVYEDGVPKIIICDGMYPDANNCGMTDILSPVPKFTLPKSSYATKSCTLYIGARYDQEAQKTEMAFYTSESYNEKPSWANEKGSHGEIALGGIMYNDAISRWTFQYFRRGEIIWGREFYIP